MLFILPFSDDNIRHVGAHALSSRNQSVSQLVSSAKFSAVGARPTLALCSSPLYRRSVLQATDPG